MKPVLVLDACQRSALAVTRNLGSKGIQVYTADETESALAGRSKYALRYFVTPSPQLVPHDFINMIAYICRKHEIGIIMPMTELTTTLVMANSNSLPNVSLPFPDLDTVNTLSDKCALIKLAQTLDIPVPKSMILDPGADISNFEALNYPIALKPGKSWIEYCDQWLHTSVSIAHSPTEALDKVTNDVAFHVHPFILQQYIPGSGAGVFALYDRGKPVSFFAHQRLREKPPRGGLSVLSESVQVDPTLQSYTQKLLDQVGWHGVAMVEFRVDPEGKAYLMEINTRFWGSLQLAVDAGVDFPWLLYQLASGEKVEPVVNYKTGIRLRWLLGDLDSLYLVLRDVEFSLKEKLKAFVAFLTPSPFKTRHEVNRWGDMGPFWWELRQYVKDLFR